jgi:hypothetical protein
MTRRYSVFSVLVVVGGAGCDRSAAPSDAGASAITTATPSARVEKFVWTANPTMDVIPAFTPRGEANGRPFDVKTVLFEPYGKTWRMTLAAMKLASPTDTVNDAPYITVQLPEAPTTGKKWTVAKGEGYFQIMTKDDPQSTTSWESKNAYALEITEWNAKPWDPKGPDQQLAGTASGRVFVAYQADSDFKNSGAAGTFKNAVVRYSGAPEWAHAAHKK